MNKPLPPTTVKSYGDDLLVRFAVYHHGEQLECKQKIPAADVQRLMDSNASTDYIAQVLLNHLTPRLRNVLAAQVRKVPAPTP